ncbi:hypothetical protein K3727_13465 [Rhodobacteraceae bacterium M382]|nr:hypothetical protein K3727_13465 [Rhodobacteraceae bacterium M382]
MNQEVVIDETRAVAHGNLARLDALNPREFAMARAADLDMRYNMARNAGKSFVR